MAPFWLLVDAKVEMLLVGGAAAALHGSARVTLDVDVVYCRSDENLTRITTALAPVSPYLRGAPPGLPFRLDPATLRRGLNFTLTTCVGDVDLLGEVAGGGTYESLLPHSVEMTVEGRAFRVVDLATLVRLKRAAGRPKDLESIAELETLLEASRRSSGE
jgi:hypothetical protein